MTRSMDKGVPTGNTKGVEYSELIQNVPLECTVHTRAWPTGTLGTPCNATNDKER